MAERRPRSVFLQEYLDWLEERDDPATAAEADLAGPWKVEPVEGESFAVLRQWESLAAGHRPVGVFNRRETALLAAAVLPALGREPRLLLSAEEGPGGFEVRTLSGSRGLEEAGRLSKYHTELIQAMNLGEALLRHPLAFVQMLHAAGPTAQERIGELLAAGLAAGEH